MDSTSYNTLKCPYKFTVKKYDRGNWYGGEIVIEAYDRTEAIAQFKDTRLSLKFVPRENDYYYPLGSDCDDFTCEPL